MGDESDNDGAPHPVTPEGGAPSSGSVRVETDGAEIERPEMERPEMEGPEIDVSVEVEPEGPPRSFPPPKPRARPPLPSVRPPAPSSPALARGGITLAKAEWSSSAPPPAPSSAEPPRATPPASSSADSRKAQSIRPMQMIKLGKDAPRAEPPPSALDRPSSLPPPPRPPAAPPERATVSDARPDDFTHPRSSTTAVDTFEPPTDPLATALPFLPEGFDAPTLPDYDDEEPLTPPRVAASERPGRRSPPPPPSARPFYDASSPQIDVTELIGVTPSLRAAVSEPVELDAGEVAPDSQDDIPFSEEPISEEPPSDEGLSVEVSITEEPPIEAPRPPLQSSPPQEGASSEKAPRKPPPPPKRPPTNVPRAPAEGAPAEGAPAEALESPKFEAPTKPRIKPWWEELFTDDFARAILPLSQGQVKREVDFIEDSLAVAKGAVILDLACGTGNHTVELASRGYGVVGFDLSVPQLAVAGEYAQERGQKINFLQGDMREMSFDGVFDSVYCWNTSFGYFEEEKNFAVAERVFRALRPGGSFLLDVANRDFVVEHQPSQVWFEGDSCVCMDDMSVDFITSRLRVKRTMMLDDGRTRECAYSIRIYSLHELGKLLHEIGFRVTEASGHPAYPGVFFGATSPRVVILAQKP